MYSLRELNCPKKLYKYTNLFLSQPTLLAAISHGFTRWRPLLYTFDGKKIGDIFGEIAVGVILFHPDQEGEKLTKWYFAEEKRWKSSIESSWSSLALRQPNFNKDFSRTLWRIDHLHQNHHWEIAYCGGWWRKEWNYCWRQINQSWSRHDCVTCQRFAGWNN